MPTPTETQAKRRAWSDLYATTAALLNELRGQEQTPAMRECRAALANVLNHYDEVPHA